VDAAARFFRALRFSGRAALIARDILPEILERLKFLTEVGLGYLQLGRAVTTLSGGEAQRIRLAAQLGSNLSGVLYILDEPTIGLHAATMRGCWRPWPRCAPAAILWWWSSTTRTPCATPTTSWTWARRGRARRPARRRRHARRAAPP